MHLFFDATYDNTLTEIQIRSTNIILQILNIILHISAYLGFSYQRLIFYSFFF